MRVALFLVSVCWTVAASADPLTVVDFTRQAGRCRIAHPALVSATPTPDGLELIWDGGDPQLYVGASFDMPVPPSDAAAVRYVLETAPCESSYGFEVFHVPVGGPFTGGKSFRVRPVGKRPYVRFEGVVRIDDPGEVMVPGKTDFRFDPPSGKGRVTLRRITLEFLPRLAKIAPRPSDPVRIGADALELRCPGGLLRHDRGRMNAWTLEWNDGICAESVPDEPFLYLDDGGTVRTLDWTKGEFRFKASGNGDRLDVGSRVRDSDGRVWKFSRRFAPMVDGIAVTTTIAVDRPARIVHLPYLTVIADRSSAGHKMQALLPGVEYLEDEPSSSEKEIRGPLANRLMPAPDKICYPLLLVTQKDHGTALSWNRPDGADQPFSAVFDSPDRVFASSGHLLGLWAPVPGPSRPEFDPLVIYSSEPFEGGTCTARLRVTGGGSVARVLAELIGPEDLPPVPSATAEEYCRTLSKGWLDSRIRVGNRWRHAWSEAPGHFGPLPASDVPTLLGWLAVRTRDAGLRARLDRAASETLAELPPDGERRGWGASVSHVHRHVAPLVFGDLASFVRTMTGEAERHRCAMSDGAVRYRPDKVDYASTLGADDCNGYTAITASSMMKAAVWTGDEKVISNALAAVDRMLDRYRGTVPRGAQPWEMPLHAPDLVASARLLATCAYAYLLSGNARYIEEAKDWAWTGMTMVYLQKAPHDYGPGIGEPVGTYATCGVMGATNWKAPYWIGRPVQWCGLVYAAALFDYARLMDGTDGAQAAFWRKVASGITASGLQQCYGADGDSGLCGLLPDSWDFAAHAQLPVPINPGTLEECACDAIGHPYYTCTRIGGNSLIHVPGDCRALPEDGVASVRILPWPRRNFKVCVTRTDRPAVVRWNGHDVPFEWDGNVLRVGLTPAAEGRLDIVR